MVAVLAGALAVVGCDSQTVVHLPKPSKIQFRDEAYPILLRDCSFAACHGTSERMFQVYGPGRVRLKKSEDEDLFPLDPATDHELEFSYERARAMLIYRETPDDSLLLHKPIQGSGHQVSDRWGRNVYPDAEAEGYQALLKWAQSAPDSEDSPAATGGANQ
jgi:hypothetical protein